MTACYTHEGRFLLGFEIRTRVSCLAKKDVPSLISTHTTLLVALRWGRGAVGGLGMTNDKAEE